MNSRTTIWILAAVSAVELLVIASMAWNWPLVPASLAEAELLAARRTVAGPERTAIAATAGAGVAAPAELVQRNAALETELVAVKKELDLRKSEISFSYGSVRDSGRFVGMTFRKMFETAAAREQKEVQERTADNQINVLSLGPFIQDAEVIESDPAAFAQFQGAVVSELLGLPPERGAEVETLLSDLKAKSLKVEEGSAEWAALNETALHGITALLSEAEKQTMRARLDFFQQYGVLVIPAYSILRAPTPTVVTPATLGAGTGSSK